MILAGDINARPDSQTLASFRQQWRLSDLQLGPTIPAGVPRSKIDYVLTLDNACAVRLVAARVIAEPTASDHRPVLVVFELPADR